jgi:hypothetical protein
MFVTSIPVTVNAVTSRELGAFGFDVPSTGYTYNSWFNSARVSHVYTSNGIAIGDCVVIAARARSSTMDSSGYYYDTLLIRSQMEPLVTKSGGLYYRGLNNKNETKFTLNTDQYYVNYYPKATMPVSSSTWDVSFYGSASVDKDFRFQIGTGYSSVTKDNCFNVSTNYTSSNKTYDILYNYAVSSGLSNTPVLKAINLWCMNTHQCFYAYTYRIKSTDTLNMTVYNNVNFRYAINYSSSWNGSTGDVYYDSSGRSAAYNIIYSDSN